MSNNKDNQYRDRARAAFNDEVDELDAATRSRLTQARYRALEELDRPRLFQTGWLPLSAVTAAVAAIVLTTLVYRHDVGELSLPETVADTSDIEILLSEEELEFLQELEFFAWLETQPEFETIDAAVDGAG